MEENAQNIISVFSLLLSLLGLAYLAFWRFRQLRVDEFRQDVFILRDELFDYAAKGNISFEHPAYQMLRDLMNGYIRFSHLILMAHYISVVVSNYIFNRGYAPVKFSDKWALATKDLDSESKAKLEDLRERVSSELFHYIFFSSYLKKIVALISGVGLYILIKFLKKKKAASKKEFEVYAYRYSEQNFVKVKESIDTFNDEAYVFGKPC